MTRPQIIRADTLDLQDQHSPSAQDHSRQPTQPAPLGIGPAAPHQQSAIRQVEQERADEEHWDHNRHTLRDEPGSDDESTVVQNGQDQRQDELAVRQNGGISGSQDDADMDDADVDDGLDDDMMDKISSSPSIDDGGYNFSSASPSRNAYSTPPRQTRTSSLQNMSSPGEGDSSPFLSTPLHLPLGIARRSRNSSSEELRSSASSMYTSSPKHLPLSFNRQLAESRRCGEYHGTLSSNLELDPQFQALRLAEDAESEDESRDILTPLAGDRLVSAINKRLENREQDSVSDIREDDLRDLLLPIDDSLLDNSFDDEVLLSPRPLPELPKSTLPGSTGTPNSPTSPTGSSDGWDTDSDDSATWTDDEDVMKVSFSTDPRFVDSGWGGECLRDSEDIDFEFVYALHTFVATVEGQANATKGDTMVLLDDSNSYWWLVRIVKDSTIGYLPAEHIETPTERLARLNKHRNIDLSATMLGDNAERSKNPLKKAIRRRNAKNVTFGGPTYVEASDYDYSSDEEDDEDVEKALMAAAEQQQQQEAQKMETDERSGDDAILAVEPLKVNGTKKDSKSDGQENNETQDKARAVGPKISKNGTMRNTDSFFKDDNTETRKITITPNILRDDSSGRSSDSHERGPSLDSFLEKSSSAEKTKDDKKKKEKKPGMLSGLFKRKDKKKGSTDDYGEEKVSEELSRGSMETKESMDSTTEKSEIDSMEKPQRQSSRGKIQKQSKSVRETSPKKVISSIRTDSPEDVRQRSDLSSNPKPIQNGTSTMRKVDSENGVQTSSKSSPTESSLKKETKAEARAETTTSQSRSLKSRNPFADPDNSRMQIDTKTVVDHLLESPVQVSPVDTTEPPALVLDNSSQEEPVSPSSSPSIIDMPIEAPPAPQASTHQPASQPPSRPAPAPAAKDSAASPSPPPGPAWSDAHLRTYMDDSTDVRDLLLVVHDKSGVVPVGSDHPIMAGLFAKETKRIKELDSSLDTLLGDWLNKKRSRSVASTSSR
ncbi:hypothetical protein EJ05DRAFT_481584 [Pseudovirgaria hyperparasitica]|uniref:SH3 domain-containing protein n=1 Tax=Pseudovirgaria hyperparasitica TaxID=470096 RepID=A0A6A6WKF7_9PEZI|nr:uncharacterized protein EJ05DRAFT_481584 [Pseudovirgaria hyperparasitica]KAF2762675.1 hypothetical protein EJ05DRAFT_481584 [Pseudovirgaria hyperparasitica]